MKLNHSMHHSVYHSVSCFTHIHRWMALATVKRRWGIKYQCLNQEQVWISLSKWKNATRSATRLTHYVVMCFKSPLNDLIALPNCTQTWERQIIDGMGKIWCHRKVAMYFWAFPMFNSWRHCCVMSFKHLNLIKIPVYYLSMFHAPKIPDAVIHYSC